MELRIEYVPTDSIRPYAGNAKKHPADQIEQIKQSIEEFGFNDPIAVWHGEIVEGHGRLMAAEELGLESVPVIRLEDLSDEQRRAYTLVHNKLTLISGFDSSILDAELGAIESIDMSAYGFEPDEVDGWFGQERERTDRAYNLDKIGELTGNFWQMPVIFDSGYIPERMLGFNCAKTSKDKNACIHFYLDDYQFERVWNEPEKYTGVLAAYDGMLCPDFSLYMDMPMPMKIWNVYRSRAIGAFYQSRGINVIPSVSWAEPDTYQFCFEGILEGSVVSVSTVGVMRNKAAQDVYRDGVREMISRIKPRAVLVYGNPVECDYGDADVRYYKNEVTEAWSNGR